MPKMVYKHANQSLSLFFRREPGEFDESKNFCLNATILSSIRTAFVYPPKKWISSWIFFYLVTPADFQANLTIRRDGNKLIHEQRDPITKNFSTTIVREVIDGKCVQIYIVGSVVAREFTSELLNLNCIILVL